MRGTAGMKDKSMRRIGSVLIALLLLVALACPKALAGERELGVESDASGTRPSAMTDSSMGEEGLVEAAPRPVPRRSRSQAR